MEAFQIYTAPAFINDPKYHQLFDYLYDSLMHRDGFEQFLQGLKSHFQSCSVALLAFHSDSRQLEWSWMAGATQAQFTHWCREHDNSLVNLLVERLNPQVQADKPFLCTGLMLDTELVNVVGDDLRPWLVKQGIVDTAALVIPIGEHGHALLALQRDAGTGRFSAIDLQALDLLVPHIRRVARLLYRQYYSTNTNLPSVGLPSAEAIRSRFPLSPTEAVVCEMLVRQLTPKQIARARDVSVHTVREQMRKIYLKTGCRRQTDVVAVILQAFAGQPMTGLQPGM